MGQALPNSEGQPASSISMGTGQFDFEDFFDNGGIALHLVDGSGTILHANRAELKFLGYSAEDYIGRNIAEFHADAAIIEDILDRLKRGESLRKYPARLRARDNSIKHVEITSSAEFPWMASSLTPAASRSMSPT